MNYKKDEWGRSLLDLAVYTSSPSIVQELLDLGADPNKQGRDGHTPLHHAVRLNNQVLIKLLLHRGADLHTKTNHKENPLHMAPKFSRDPELFQLLLNLGVNINEKNKDGHIPAIVALKHHKRWHSVVCEPLVHWSHLTYLLQIFLIVFVLSQSNTFSHLVITSVICTVSSFTAAVPVLIISSATLTILLFFSF